MRLSQLLLFLLILPLGSFQGVLLGDVIGHELEQVLVLDVEGIGPRCVDRAVSEDSTLEVDIRDALVLDCTHACNTVVGEKTVHGLQDGISLWLLLVEH